MSECNVCEKCPLFPESHTTKEWMELPDKVSVKNKLYVVSDYRTDDVLDIPRFKFGDGITMISQLPWVTAAITDNDIEFWDMKVDSHSDLGKCIVIDEEHASYSFPSDGYIILEFHGRDIEYAEVRIYGASGKSHFTFSKCTDRDNQSKEVFVRKGMKCAFITASKNAVIKFVPLV